MVDTFHFPHGLPASCCRGGATFDHLWCGVNPTGDRWTWVSSVMPMSWTVTPLARGLLGCPSEGVCAALSRRLRKQHPVTPTRTLPSPTRWPT